MAYTLIQSYTLASTTNNVTFSAIPSSYIDLSVFVCARGATSSLNLLFSTNNTQTVKELLTFYNSAFTSGIPQAAPLSSTLIQYAYEGSTATTANTFSNTEVYYRNYSSATLGKKMIVQSSVSANVAQGTPGAVVAISAAYQQTTNAITSVTVEPDVPSSNAFQIGSTFYLYGLS